MRSFLLGVLGILCGETAFAASPTVGIVLPRGGQRGTEVTLTFQGATSRTLRKSSSTIPALPFKKLKASKRTR